MMSGPDPSSAHAPTSDHKPHRPDAPDGGARRMRGVVLLSIVTLIWGTTFVIIRALVGRSGAAAAALPPAVLTLVRFAIAAALFLPFARPGRRLWVAGAELGMWLWCGYASQAQGLVHTTASRSAFITVLHVVFVPVLAALGGRRMPVLIWAAAGLAVGGAGLLSYDGAAPNRGDAWTLVTALTYAVYILRLERWTAHLPAMPLTFAQLTTVTLLSLGWTLAAPDARAALPRLGGLPLPAIAGLLWLGVVATAITTWFSAVGQRLVPAPQASLIYTLEPAWGYAFAYLFLAERLTPLGWAGAALILLAAGASQWPGGAGRRRADRMPRQKFQSPSWILSCIA